MIDFINNNEEVFSAIILSCFVLLIIYLPDIMLSLYGGDDNEEKERK